MSFARCNWLNPPATWRLQHDRLTAVTDQGSDFWRETQYGFTRDTGHLFACDAPGGFTAQLRVRAQFTALYDQAGLMARVDERNWIKAGIELSDGQAMLGSVLTLGRSDWATGAYGADPADFWVRMTVKEGVVRVQASADGRRWPLVRLAPFPEAAFYRVGPMCCTPERAGLEVAFSDFTVGPPLDRGLHDLS